MKRIQLSFASLAVTIALYGCGGSSSGSSSTTQPTGNYVQTNLVGDNAAQKPAVVDPNLVNSWGISYSPSGAFWISDNGTGLSTLYNGAGAIQSLVVHIPAAGGGTNGPVSGQVYNGTGDFQRPGGGASPFIFVSEDGLITAWGSGTAAVTVVDRSATGAVYKGVALGVYNGSNFLYATNFNANSVDVFDENFTLTQSFTDSALPAGYAPFGIANIGGLLYVTFALQNAAKHDDVAGAGHGYVDVFNPSGALVRRLISQGPLNSPWGIVQAPSGFGKVGGDLLIGNFGDGRINAFNISSGALQGPLNNSAGTPLVIGGLWALIFGNGGSGGATNTLYFTAGPNGENDGLFGSLTG